MNLPTKLTFTRMIIAGIIIFILLFPFYAVSINFPKYLIEGVVIDSKYIMVGILFILAVITDIFDSYLANKNKIETEFGKTLETLTNKILLYSVLIIFSTLGFINVIIPVVLVVCDFVIDAITIRVVARGKILMSSNVSIIKKWTLMAGIVLVFFYNMPFEIWNIRVDLFLLYFSAIMTVISVIEYYQANKRFIFSKENN